MLVKFAGIMHSCVNITSRRVFCWSLYNAELGVCDHLTDDYDVGALHDRIEELYNSVVEALNISADLCIPRTRRNFYKFWWSQELTELKAAAVNSARAW